MAKYRLGVIGHRELGNESTRLFVNQVSERVISFYKQLNDELVVTSALAEGADSIFTEVAASLNVSIENIIPHFDFEKDFSEQNEKIKNRRLQDIAAKNYRLNFSKSSVNAYKKSMELIVFRSNLLVAIWDGKEIGSECGTWFGVKVCRQLAKCFIHIDTSVRETYLVQFNGQEYEKRNLENALHV